MLSRVLIDAREKVRRERVEAMSRCDVRETAKQCPYLLPVDFVSEK